MLLRHLLTDYFKDAFRYRLFYWKLKIIKKLLFIGQVLFICLIALFMEQELVKNFKYINKKKLKMQNAECVSTIQTAPTQKYK